MRIQGNPVHRYSRLVLCCTLLVLSCAASAQARGPGDVDNLTVVESAGAVKIKLENRWQTPQSGMAVSLPATVSTGADGSIRIKQNATIITIAANTAIEFLEGTEPGLPLQRVIQNQGSAFYDIAPRESSKLRVETPYLVAVIKGTQFNVTVAAETSTVALFEGRLQIEAPDVGDVVDLHEGQIAKRRKGAPAITVLNMQTGEPVARSNEIPPGGQGQPGSAGNDISFDEEGGSAMIDGDVPLHGDDVQDGGAPDTALVADDGAGPDQGGVKSDIDSVLSLSPEELAPGLPLIDSSVDLGVEAAVNLVGGGIDVGLDAEVDLGDAHVDLDVDSGLDLNEGTIDLAIDGGIGVGDAVVDVGIDAGVDLGAGDIDLGVESGVDLGGVVADVGIDAGLDIGAGTGDLGVDLGVDGGLDLGGDPVADVGVDAGIDLDAGDIDAGLDAAIDLGDSTVEAGLDAGIELDDGSIDADIDLGVADAGAEVGLEINPGDLDDLADLDLDLGLLDGDDAGTDSGNVEDDDDDSLPIVPRNLLDLLGL